MAYAMEAAAPSGLRVVVLDRPNPIGPAGVRGPMLDPALRSFTGYFAMPVQHAMTIGEVAAMVEGENRIGGKLDVVAMRGYRRDLWFDQTGLAWIAPSPNLRSLDEAILYPGVALIEGTNVSVGRGTQSPFEIVGAPWIDGQALAKALTGRDLRGVRLDPAQFTRPRTLTRDAFARASGSRSPIAPCLTGRDLASNWRLRCGVLTPGASISPACSATWARAKAWPPWPRERTPGSSPPVGRRRCGVLKPFAPITCSTDRLVR